MPTYVKESATISTDTERAMFTRNERHYNNHRSERKWNGKHHSIESSLLQRPNTMSVGNLKMQLSGSKTKPRISGGKRNYRRQKVYDQGYSTATVRAPLSGAGKAHFESSGPGSGVLPSMGRS